MYSNLSTLLIQNFHENKIKYKTPRYVIIRNTMNLSEPYDSFGNSDIGCTLNKLSIYIL